MARPSRRTGRRRQALVAAPGACTGERSRRFSCRHRLARCCRHTRTDTCAPQRCTETQLCLGGLLFRSPAGGQPFGPGKGCVLVPWMVCMGIFSVNMRCTQLEALVRVLETAHDREKTTICIEEVYMYYIHPCTVYEHPMRREEQQLPQ